MNSVAKIKLVKIRGKNCTDARQKRQILLRPVAGANMKRSVTKKKEVMNRHGELDSSRRSRRGLRAEGSESKFKKKRPGSGIEKAGRSA